ncbi:ATP-binding protein [Porticoccaceae bacterium]|nr:ATP-binding protein [Porticoccaceae bacterium]
MKFPFDHNSISSRLIVTGLLPLALLSVLMAFYFISNQRAEMLSNLHDTGHIAVRQVSQNTAFALYAGDRKRLDALSYATLETPSVEGVVFYSYKDNEQIKIGSIGPSNGEIPANVDISVPFEMGGYWYFYSEIISERSPIMDFEEEVEYEPEKIGWVLVSLSDKILRQKERSFVLTAATVVLLSLLLAFWLSIRISRTVSEPLETLKDVVGKMEAGDLNPVANETGISELAKLARGINSLADSVRESNQLMQSEIDRATQELKKTLTDLEKAMRTKDQFLARMSHELRTPLTAVLGFSKMLHDEGEELNRNEQLRVIQRCSTVLLTMIDDVLDFSRAERSGFTLNIVAFELDKLVEDLNALFTREASNKNLSLNIDLDNTVPVYLFGDPVRLAQVISNVLNNAIKFTESGSIGLAITIQQSNQDKVVLKFVITDTGKGIAKPKIPSLFDPFIQEDTSINRRYGGSGLGLSIAKRLVVAMGGDINIDSEVGQGTTVAFTCEFTHNENAIAAKQIEDINQQLAGDMLSGVSILVAEDNEFNQQLLVKLLEHHGAVCKVANNGQEAINMSAADIFDVILMDLHMPIVDGMEATKNLAKNVGSPPIIGLTADITDSVKRQLMDAGAKSVQQKPIDEIKLMNTVLEVLKPKSEQTQFSGEGMLSSVIPIADLKKEIERNLDSLEASFRDRDQAAMNSLLHDLMGFCGLYGISEIRALVVELRGSEIDAASTNSKSFEIINRIRQYMETSAKFKSTEPVQ